MTEDLRSVFDKIEKAENIINELEKKRSDSTVEPEAGEILSKEHLDAIENARKTISSLKDKLSKELTTKTLNLDKCQEELSILQARLKVGQIDEAEYAAKSKHLLDKINSLDKKVTGIQNVINTRFAEDIVPVLESEEAISIVKEIVEKKENEDILISAEVSLSEKKEEADKETELQPAQPSGTKQEEMPQAQIEQTAGIKQEEIQEATEQVPQEQLIEPVPGLLTQIPSVPETEDHQEAASQIENQFEGSIKIEEQHSVNKIERMPDEAIPVIDMGSKSKEEKSGTNAENAAQSTSKKVPSPKGHKPSLHLHRIDEPVSNKKYTSVGDAIKKNGVLVVVIAIFVLGLLGWGSWALFVPSTGSAVGNAAPDFVMQTGDNNTYSLSSLKGKNVILVFWDRDFWDSQFFYINGVARKLYNPDKLSELLSKDTGDTLAIVAIASGTTNNEVDKLIHDYEVSFPVIVDSFGKLRESYEVKYEPTYIFLDKNGIIRGRVEGPITSISDLEQYVYNTSKNVAIKSPEPPIDKVIVQSISEKSATVNWSTAVPTTTQLDIDGKNIQTILSPTTQTLHSLTLRDLSPATSYQVRIVYNINNITVSEHSFSALADTIVSKRYPLITSNTDSSYPEISNTSTGFVTDSSATVTWKTDEPATGDVYYSTDKSYSGKSSQGDKLTIWHTVKIEELTPDTEYYLKISSKDAGGKETSQEIDTVKTQNLIEVAPVIGKRAPDFSLYSVDGVKFSLSQFAGRKILLNFWLEGCPACETEMPLIQKAYEKYTRDELIVLAVNVRGDTDKVSYFIGKENLTFPVVIDNTGDVDGIYRAPYFPTSYFIDTKGIIREIITQRFQTVSEIDDILTKLE